MSSSFPGHHLWKWIENSPPFFRGGALAGKSLAFLLAFSPPSILFTIGQKFLSLKVAVFRCFHFFLFQTFNVSLFVHEEHNYKDSFGLRIYACANFPGAWFLFMPSFPSFSHFSPSFFSLEHRLFFLRLRSSHMMDCFFPIAGRLFDAFFPFRVFSPFDKNGWRYCFHEFPSPCPFTVFLDFCCFRCGPRSRERSFFDFKSFFCLRFSRRYWNSIPPSNSFPFRPFSPVFFFADSFQGKSEGSHPGGRVGSN